MGQILNGIFFTSLTKTHAFLTFMIAFIHIGDSMKINITLFWHVCLKTTQKYTNNFFHLKKNNKSIG